MPSESDSQYMVQGSALLRHSFIFVCAVNSTFESQNVGIFSVPASCELHRIPLMAQIVVEHACSFQLRVIPPERLMVAMSASLCPLRVLLLASCELALEDVLHTCVHAVSLHAVCINIKLALLSIGIT